MTEPIKVLLVEDNPADIELTRESLETGKIKIQLEAVCDGVEALDFVFRRNQYAAAFRPDLVLLDLNLPKKDGKEVLTEMKNSPELRRIPIVVLTSSDAESDILKTYDLGANCYITKPVSLSQFQTIVRSIENFWFIVAKLPPD